MSFQVDTMYYHYLGERVEVTIKHYKTKKKRLCIGTFLATDNFLNLVLEDSYFVVMNKGEQQRKDMGLMLIRGQSVMTVSLVTNETKMPIWPTEPVKKVKAKKKKVLDAKPEVPAPMIPPKPVKLKRSWLTNPESSSMDPQPEPGESLSSKEAIVEELMDEEYLLGEKGNDILASHSEK